VALEDLLLLPRLVVFGKKKKSLGYELRVKLLPKPWLHSEEES
jgi:hypothetical protein